MRCSGCTGRIFVDRRGYGVIGLLVSVFFVSVVAAGAVPRLVGMERTMRLDREAARLAAELMRYRETIMTRQPIHQDFVGVASEVEPKFELLPDSYRIREGMKAQEVYKLPSGMQMSWSGGEVQFRMTGNAQPMTIYLKAGKEMRYVIIDRVGRVRVSLSPPED